MNNEAIKILVVDSDTQTYDRTKLAIDSLENFLVDSENDISQAEEKISQGNYDIILVDQKASLSNEIDVSAIHEEDGIMPLIVYLTENPSNLISRFSDDENVFEHITREQISTDVFLRILYYAAVLVRYHRNRQSAMDEFKEEVMKEKDYTLQKARHDLSNLLTSILGSAELLLMGRYELDDKTKAKVEIIRNMGTEMLEKLKTLR